MLQLCYMGLSNDLNFDIYNLLILINISQKIVLYDEFLWKKSILEQITKLFHC